MTYCNKFGLNIVPADQRIALESLFIDLDIILLKWIDYERRKLPKRKALPASLAKERVGEIEVLIPRIYAAAMRLQSQIRKACKTHARLKGKA